VVINKRTSIFHWLIIITSAALLVYNFGDNPPDFNPFSHIILFIFLSIVAELFSISIGHLSISGVVALAIGSIAIFGITAGMVIKVFSHFIYQCVFNYNKFSEHKRLEVVLFNLAQDIISLHVGYFVFSKFLPNLPIAAGLGIFTYMLSNNLLVNLSLWIRTQLHNPKVWIKYIKWDIATYGVTVPAGLLTVNFYRQGNYFELLMVIGLFVISNHILRLYIRTKELNKELETLHKIGKTLSSTLNIDDILNQIMDATHEIMEYDFGCLFFNDSGVLSPVIYRGEEGVDIKNLRIKLGEGVIGSVAKDGKGEVIYYSYKDTRNKYFEGIPKDVLSAVVVPLINNDTLIGTIVLAHKASNFYDYKHLRLITTLANKASIAIVNARLFQRTVDLAQKDELTKLYNHRTFCNTMQRLIEKRQLFSLIILDIDYFKKFNDKYGHLVGNEILVKISEIILENVRDEDIVCRIGGEEFAIILPKVGTEVAKSVAERIRESVEEYKFMADRIKGSFTNLTISAGVSSYPKDGRTMDELMYCADHALLRGAKDGGRNRVVIYDSQTNLEGIWNV
jgi:diguanylate cyclase (GGDEF)-like protein